MNDIKEYRLSKLSKLVLTLKSRLLASDSYQNESPKTVVNYAEFLGRPLTRGIFVACDSNDKVLNRPERYDHYCEHGQYGLIKKKSAEYAECVKYHEAKKQVLFKDVEISWVTNKFQQEQFYGVTVNGQWCGGWDNFKSSYLRDGETIEALCTLKEELRPCLTDTAINQIFE